MHANILPQATTKVLSKLKDRQFLKTFYLSGGTALSLHLGHRESEDLDFFSQESFKPLAIQQKLEKISQVKDVQTAEATLNLYLQSVRLQFLHYPYRLLKPTVKWQGIQLASVLDIACTKLQTIASRGSKKDFIDLYVLLKKYPLKKLVSSMKQKYQGSDYNLPHILKSLVYFADADNQPMPRMHLDLDWAKVKKELKKTIQVFKL